MSIQNPLRLLNLAGKSLLTVEALAISTLEYLPIELFPTLHGSILGKTQKDFKGLGSSLALCPSALGA